MSDSFFKRWIHINDMDYARDMESYFSEFKSHPAVTFFEETWTRDMSSYIPPEIMIYLSDDFEEQEGLTIPQEILDHIGGIDKKNEFVRNIRDFANVTNFNKFFKLHQDYYESLSSKVLELITKMNCIPGLNEFYGTSQHHYFGLLVPLLGPGNGYGPSIPTESGELDVYCLFSPYQTDEQIINLLWHEFGHSFVNPVIAKQSDKVKDSDRLYYPIETFMKPLYSNWENSLCEHLVRVITTELVKGKYGNRKAKQQISMHENQGFLYMRPLTNLIEDYNNHRSDYPTFESYVPQLLYELQNLDPADYQTNDGDVFNGPLNSVSKNVSHIIIPTNEVNDSIEVNIRKYCTHIQSFLQERYNSEILIITDNEALESDISGGDLMVYGTINGNLWLQAHIEELPFRLEADKIIADKVFKGENLRFISAWPHFHDKSKGMAIYTAQRAEDIWGINGINHGSTDYIIIDGENVLGSGNYKKKEAQWDF
jgi:hypothetical protein